MAKLLATNTACTRHNCQQKRNTFRHYSTAQSSLGNNGCWQAQESFIWQLGLLGGSERSHLQLITAGQVFELTSLCLYTRSFN